MNSALTRNLNSMTQKIKPKPSTLLSHREEVMSETQSKCCFLVQDTIYTDSVFPSEPLQRNIIGQIFMEKISMKSSKIKKKNPPQKYFSKKYGPIHIKTLLVH